MARKTYPNTPEEEAARINKESGDPNSITAEQVAANRKLNEDLTNALGFGEGGSGFSLSENPFAGLVSGVSDTVKKFAEDAGAALQTAESEIDKADLNAKINELSGGIGSGLNGATAGIDFGGQQFTTIDGIGVEDPNFKSTLGGISGVVDSATKAAGAAGGALSSLASDASGLVDKFPGAAEIKSSLSKLTGGDLASGVSGLAGSISKAAGALNDILSLKRGANLPEGAELFKQTGTAIKLDSNPADDWRVRLNANWSYFGGSPLMKELKKTGGLVWPVLPTITLSTSANYSEISPTHNNYPFQAYKNSKVDDISIGGQFPAETETDAAYWIAATTFLRTATKMFYGQGELAGNPPIVCYLSGYGASVFDNVPVVVKNFTVDFPNDVNYVKCNKFGTSTWVPILSTISCTVTPIYNRSNMRQFSLKDFAAGKLTSPDGSGYL